MEALQALVDRKKVVITEATIRDALRLDDAEGVDCLPNEEIFTELARMGYEKPSTKLTFYKAFFSSQLKFLIHTILQCMSAKRTSWNEFSSSVASAVICLSTGRKINLSKYMFDSLVRNVDSTTKFYKYPRFLLLIIRKQVGDLSTHTTKYASPTLTQKIKEEGDADEHVEEINTGDAAHGDRVDTFDDTIMDDESNQERMIVEMDKDDAVVLMDDKEEDKKVEEAKEDETELAKVQEVVDVVTTAKLITEVVTAASETVTAASAIISTAEPQVPAATLTATPARVVAAPSRRRKGLDKQYAKELHAEINKDIDWDEAINYVKKKAKEDPTVQRYQVLKRKPQTEAQARNNMIVYLKNVTNEQIKEEENRALQTINETLAEKVAKRRKLNEEVEDLKGHLQIMPNEDDDVYTEATSLAGKVPIMDYEIIEINNKPYYKIIRVDETHQLYISFLTLLRNFDREDLEALWSLVKERFSTVKPKNFFDDFLLTTLGAMFEKPDVHAQIWKNQRTVHGQAKVKSWKLLEPCDVHIITFTTTQLILLVEKSSAQSEKHDDKTKREAKGKSHVESLTGYRNLSAKFEDIYDNSINEVNVASTLVPAIWQISPNSTNTFSVAGPSNAAASPTQGKSSCIDTSQLLDDPDMLELEDITYSDDEDDVGIKRIKEALWSGTKLDLLHKDTQEEAIDYEEVFAPVARIEAIRLFLAYASFMGFIVYQMDVKSAFLYGTIEEEVYVCQPLGFEDPDYPNKVYKVVKALYGLHQALRAWYETLANYLLKMVFKEEK
nr:putative ribonuclease H-like domain-containing protein [Tanacetum cinerariifolium]